MAALVWVYQAGLSPTGAPITITTILGNPISIMVPQLREDIELADAMSVMNSLIARGIFRTPRYSCQRTGYKLQKRLGCDNQAVFYVWSYCIIKLIADCSGGECELKGATMYFSVRRLAV